MKTQKEKRFLNMEEHQLSKRKWRFAKQKQRRNIKKTKVNAKMHKKNKLTRHLLELLQNIPNVNESSAHAAV